MRCLPVVVQFLSTFTFWVLKTEGLWVTLERAGSGTFLNTVFSWLVMIEGLLVTSGRVGGSAVSFHYNPLAIDFGESVVVQILSTITSWLVTIERLPVTLVRIDGSAFSFHYQLLSSHVWGYNGTRYHEKQKTNIQSTKCLFYSFFRKSLPNTKKVFIITMVLPPHMGIIIISPTHIRSCKYDMIKSI